MGIFRVAKRTIGRPQGYKYPVGLSFGVTGVGGFSTSNAATNTSGGTQTMANLMLFILTLHLGLLTLVLMV